MAMKKLDPAMAFRASEEDRKIISDLMKRLGQSASGIIRLALRRLYEEENRRSKRK